MLATVLVFRHPEYLNLGQLCPAGWYFCLPGVEDWPEGPFDSPREAVEHVRIYPRYRDALIDYRAARATGERVPAPLLAAGWFKKFTPSLTKV